MDSEASLRVQEKCKSRRADRPPHQKTKWTSPPASSESAACVRNVAGDLRFQGVKVCETLFVAQFLDKGNFEFLTVKIPGKIQQVNFHPRLNG